MKSWAIFLMAFSLLSTPASAADWYTGSPADEVVVIKEKRKNFGAAVDVSVTADTKDTHFVAIIGTIAPFTSMDETGARLRGSGVFGTYRYIGYNGIGRRKGTQSEGSFMVGYEWVATRGSIAVYAGFDYNDNRIDKFDPYNGAIGSTAGGKIALDFYIRPSAITMMSGTMSFSSAHSAYYGRIKAGVAVAPDIYVGPEMLFLGDNFFRQWRLGAHVTGLTAGPVQIGADLGFLSDRVRGTGLYGGVDARVKF